MHVLFHIAPEAGSLEATYELARGLHERGHDVTYTAIEDVAPMIEARGLRCARIHARAVPHGTLAAIEQLSTEEEHAWAAIELADRIADDYFLGAIETMLRTLAPSIVIADVALFSPIQFAAHRLGIPCVQLSLTLPQRFDELPPLSSPQNADAATLSLASARWLAHTLHRRAGALRIPMVTSAMIDRYAARFGYPAAHISFEAALDPALTLFPELIACASALDLPRVHGSPRFIAIPLEIPREIDRAEPVLVELTAFVDATRPLIFAALGEPLPLRPQIERWFDAVVETLRARPNWNAVIAVPSQLDATLHGLPANVRAVRNAPRQWLLEHAAVFLTDAGLTDLRRAIMHAVPIVAIPHQRDQPGNAMRVVHHGIGVQLPANLITTAGLTVAIERVLAAASASRARLRALDDACRAEQAEAGVAIIESLARPQPAAPMTSAADADEVATTRFERILAGVPSSAAATDMLYGYAAWCALGALEPEREAAPDQVAMMCVLLAEHRRLVAEHASVAALAASSHAIRARAVKRWHRGYGAAAFAVHVNPQLAARLSRIEALLSLARQHVELDAGTATAAARCHDRYRELAALFDAELERRVAELLDGAVRTGVDL